MTLDDLKQLLLGAAGNQTPGTDQATQQFLQRDQSQDKLGQVIQPAGLIPNALTALQALHPDQPRYMGGQEVLGGMAVPWGGKGKLPEGEIDRRINAKNFVYHATYPDAFEQIMTSGRIGTPGWLKDEPYRPVSLSRVPTISYTKNRGITLALDPTALPPTTPLAEGGFKKTLQGYGPTSPMNPDFEYEDRTSGQKPIPISAIRKILVDPSKGGDMDRVNKLAAGKPFTVEEVTQKTRQLNKILESDPGLKQKLLEATQRPISKAAAAAANYPSYAFKDPLLQEAYETVNKKTQWNTEEEPFMVQKAAPTN